MRSAAGNRPGHVNGSGLSSGVGRSLEIGATVNPNPNGYAINRCYSYIATKSNEKLRVNIKIRFTIEVQLGLGFGLGLGIGLGLRVSRALFSENEHASMADTVDIAAYKAPATSEHCRK